MPKSTESEAQQTEAHVDLQLLARFLSGDPRIVTATVFGSAQNGTVQPGSDLDIGLLFPERLSGDAFLAFYSELCEAVPDIEVIDVVSLNDANPILAFEAINGRFLVKNDMEKAAEFVSLVCREYEDVMVNLERQRQWAA